MSIVTCAPTNPLRSLFSYVPVILSVFFLVGPLHAGTTAIDNETGIKGKVLRGPVYPGPEIAGKRDEEPFSAAFNVLNSEKEKVARFESDDKGRFKVLLPPGEYAIVPGKAAPILFPQRQKKDVTVPEDGFAEVTLKFDTGMK